MKTANKELEKLKKHDDVLNSDVTGPNVLSN
jgi:hypothetical protein